MTNITQFPTQSTETTQVASSKPSSDKSFSTDSLLQAQREIRDSKATIARSAASNATLTLKVETFQGRLTRHSINNQQNRGHSPEAIDDLNNTIHTLGRKLEANLDLTYSTNHKKYLDFFVSEIEPSFLFKELVKPL